MDPNMSSDPSHATDPVKAEVDAELSLRSHKRRPHTKSRNGCTTCKRRRVKCDETRPVCKNCQHLRLECLYASPAVLSCADLQLMNLRLLHHYDTEVARTISDSGISTEAIWSRDVVEMGLEFPFLMHAILMFSATHLAQREPKEYCNVVVQHRSMALTLLRSEVQHINSENLDPLVATSVLLILDAMANASLPSRMTPSSLPASTWLHHVRGAATILLAVGVQPPTSKFYSFMGFDLLDLASCYPPGATQGQPAPHAYSDLQCTIPELEPLYPVAYDSPYYASLTFLGRLNDQRDRADFILRIFSFPALMDKSFVALLASGDRFAKLIVSAYYRLVRQYVKARQHRVWFLEGVSTVLPIDTDNEFGGLGFVTDALPIPQNVDSILSRFDEVYAAAEQKLSQIVKMNSQPSSQFPSTKPSTAPSAAPSNMASRSSTQPGTRTNTPTPPGLSPGQGATNQAPNQMASNQVAPDQLAVKLQNLERPEQYEQYPDQYNQEYQRFQRPQYMVSPPEQHSASSMSTPTHSLAASPQAMAPANSRNMSYGQMPMNMGNQMAGGQMPVNQMNSMSGGPMSSGPMNTGPMNTGPMNASPMNASPMNAGPMNAGPMNTGPMNAGGPMSSAPMSGGSMSGPMSGGPSPQEGMEPLPGMQVSGYDPMLNSSQSLMSEIMPHTYGRIQKHMSSAGASNLPGEWRNRTQRPFGRTRNRQIVRPGMMSVPLDPSVPNDLLGGFDFGETSGQFSADVDTDMGLTPSSLEQSNLEWQSMPSDLQQPVNQWMVGQDKDAQEGGGPEPLQHKPAAFGMPPVKEEFDDNLDRLINFDDDLGLPAFD